MDKLKLIALLATVGVTLANDADEAAIEKAMTDTFGKVKAADEIAVNLANAKKDGEKSAADLKVATDTVTQLTSTLANEQVAHKTTKTEADEAKAKLGTLTAEVTKLKDDLTVANTTLVNAREERAKTASDGSKLATDLTEKTTKLGLAETALANERTEKGKLVMALANAKAGIVDLAIAFGKISPAQRTTLEAALANDVEFAGICDQLKKAQPVFKMAAILTNTKEFTADGVDAGTQYRTLINEAMNPKEGKKLSQHAATVKVNQSERGKALLALMHQPETGIPVVR